VSTGGYKIRNQQGVHFISFAVVDWIDVFTRKIYRDIIVDSLAFCQQEKSLRVHAWCIMSNHVHLLISSIENVSDILRDFKKFTSKAILSAIESNETESRRAWMLTLFRNAGQENSRNTQYQFWRQDNHPKECWSAPFTGQKLNYIHENPVAAGLVDKAEAYLYSSARDYSSGVQCGLLKIDFI
jgi:putative transposase